MNKNKIFSFISFLILLNSCSNTFDSVKRGLTGEKQLSADEFLIKKKDPLILPPDYETLPRPSDAKQTEILEQINIEEALQKTASTEETSSSGSSAEESILRQIRKQ